MSFLRSSPVATAHSRAIFAAIAATFLVVCLVGPAQAHVLKSFGVYSVSLGWVHEPAYVGAANAVQVVVKDSHGKAVTDVPAGDLTVVVSVAGQQSAALPLNNAFDEDTGLGTPGDYEASVVPTVPGDYTFHLSGMIGGTPIDETATSSESTFDSVVDSSSVDFPAKLPSIADIATRLDRLDARIAAVAASPGASATSGGAVAVPSPDHPAATDNARPASTELRDTATTALVAGAAIGVLGVVLGGLGVFFALRARRPSGA